MALAEAGYVVASIEYRVAPEVTFPKPLMDVKSAIRFLRANHKRFGIDPEHIAVMGNSAGGYLAAITGTTNGLKEFEDGENLDQKMMLKRLLIYTAYLTLIKSDTDMKKSLKKSITQPAHLRLYG
nr:alpha/beta hydrolase [Campylobacter sp. RM9328]